VTISWSFVDVHCFSSTNFDYFLPCGRTQIWNSNGRMSRDGVVSMDHLLVALGETKEERELRIRSLFNFFDAANNGYLDVAQIEAGLSALQIPPEYKYARELCDVCDANSDGRVEYHEFRRYMDDKELELYRIFQAIDVEHNGNIIPEELYEALLKAGTAIYLAFRTYSCSSNQTSFFYTG